MADGGRPPGPGFVENRSESLAKPYELSHPLSAGQVLNIDEMFRILFNAMRENEIKVDELVEDVVVLEAVVPPEATSGELVKVTYTFTNAEIQLLDTTPFVLITGVADKIIIPVLRIIEAETVVAAGGSGAWRTQWTNESGVTVIPNSAGSFGSTGPKIFIDPTQVSVFYDANTSGILGSSYEVMLTGNPLGTQLASLTLYYVIVDGAGFI